MDFTLEKYAGLIDEAVKNYVRNSRIYAPMVYEPMDYTLESGGKRLRGSLVLAVYQALTGRDCREAIHQACAVELFHNFTLIHDDVMDKADTRRGRPAVVSKWDDNVAILAGDAMLTTATRQLNLAPADRQTALREMFDRTAMEVYEGQMLDMEFETRTNVQVSEYMTMIGLKTSVLIGCACALGAIMAGASAETTDNLYHFGYETGLAFQLQDDWLDTYGDSKLFGKTIGGDIVNRKKTWLLISALHENYDELTDILAEDLEYDELYSQVRRVYDHFDIGSRCRKEANIHVERAINYLEAVELPSDARRFFNDLAHKAVDRVK